MTSPALARAFHLLDQDMLGYLDAVELLTDERESDEATVLAVARTEVPRLIAALRGTLGDHQPGPDGRCRGCAPTPWPCPVIDAAHTYLKDPNSIYPR